MVSSQFCPTNLLKQYESTLMLPDGLKSVSTVAQISYLLCWLSKLHLCLTKSEKVNGWERPGPQTQGHGLKLLIATGEPLTLLIREEAAVLPGDADS